MIKNRFLNIWCFTDMDIGLNLTKMGNVDGMGFIYCGVEDLPLSGWGAGRGI